MPTPRRPDPVLARRPYQSEGPRIAPRPRRRLEAAPPGDVVMSETRDHVGPAPHAVGGSGDHVDSGGEKRPAPRTARNYVSKSDMVTDALRELITDGQFLPGTPLRQRQLAEQFD